ncbi:MAG: RidA family protein [Candidatus Eremiobacteraeota bacterium]|nr:RidA family protein [Candidatus Eremiobacteraeota bacterium]
MSETIQPAQWPRPSGYANAILAQGRFLAISGQIGWNDAGQLVGTDFLEQALQALRNVATILRAAGGEPEHLVRLTWYILDKQEYRAALGALGRGYREILEDHYPAMALVQVADLLEEGARVEIEATAILP